MCIGAYAYDGSNLMSEFCVISIQSFVCDNIQGSISNILTVSIRSKTTKTVHYVTVFDIH